MGEEKEGVEAVKVQNPGKRFWSALNYIITSFREYGARQGRGDFGIEATSITLSAEEWDALNKRYNELEKAVLDTWEDANQIAENLVDMKLLPPEEAEVLRVSGRKRLRVFLNG
jgi:hypothetical protein